MADPDTFRVSPTLSRLPNVTAPPVESQGPAMLVRAGQTIQKAGAMASDVIREEMRQLNATRVTEGLQQLQEFQHRLAYDPEYGLFSQLGANAVNRPKPLDEDYGAQFDEQVEKLAMTLGNDAQRQMFTERARAASVAFRGRAQQHLVEQSFKYETNVLTGSITAGLRRMGEATDPNDLKAERDNISLLAGRLADMNGMAPDQKQEFIREQLTPGHGSVIGRMLATDDIDGAMSYAQSVRGEMTQEAWDKLEPVILEQRAIMEGGEIGEQIAGMFQVQNAAAAPQDIGMPVLGTYRRTGSYGDDRGKRRHGGVDFAMPIGTPVYAGASGVTRIKRDPDGYGLYVDLELDNGTTLRMAHLSATEVTDGQRVEKGAVIARSGNSGRSTGPHLHYEVIGADKTKQDPIAFHQGRPRQTAAEAPPGATLDDQLRYLYSRNLPRRQEQEAERKIRSLYGAQREAEQSRKDDISNSVWATVLRGGTPSAAEEAAMIASGQAREMVTIKDYQRAAAERAAGGSVSDEDSALKYGQLTMKIARGELRDLSALEREFPYLTDSHYKQLVDDLAAGPQTARERAERVVNLIKPEIQGSPLFQDEDDKFDKNKYARFVGAVSEQIHREGEMTGKPVTFAREQEIARGMLGREVVEGVGRAARFDIARNYRRIPSPERLRIVRDLQENGIARPSQGQVLSEFLRRNR